VKKLLLLDNFDSFTWNLFSYLQPFPGEIIVKRNDELSLEKLEILNPEAILIGPGPGRPEESGIILDLIDYAVKKRRPLLGICLGQQAIGEYFSARLVLARRTLHGKTSEVAHEGKGVFKGLRSPLQVGRYHSLALQEKSLPACLEVTARSEDGEVMAVLHRELPLEGLQFHPESVMTPEGRKMLDNFSQRFSKALDF
jgi:anthranilate synthase/aminodeoxychorismate synthase-like glutamine amidotransferase